MQIFDGCFKKKKKLREFLNPEYHQRNFLLFFRNSGVGFQKRFGNSSTVMIFFATWHDQEIIAVRLERWRAAPVKFPPNLCA